MAATIYGLCAIAAAFCTSLLTQVYLRGGYRLLLWSSVCFAALPLNTFLLVLDKVMLPAIDLAVWRTSVALLAMTILLYGLIWESE